MSDSITKPIGAGVEAVLRALDAVTARFGPGDALYVVAVFDPGQVTIIGPSCRPSFKKVDCASVDTPADREGLACLLRERFALVESFDTSFPKAGWACSQIWPRNKMTMH
jgi:hypothetical protein